MEEKNY